jgi:peptidoglycan/xylan/chitin deacetylase (PgdA/CDA1 family)
MTRNMLRISVFIAALLSGLAVVLASRGEAEEPRHAATAALTEEDRALWGTAPSDPGEIPVLLYHGIDEREGFANAADAYYGITPANFAKQMALLRHAGYTAITLEQFARFRSGEPVTLPEHPILITFDDARRDAWRNADPVLAKLGWPATLFVDVGAVSAGNHEYASWSEIAEMQRSGRWSVQLHAGRGHHSIRYGTGERDVGPFYAYRDADDGETLDGWQRRVVADLEWGSEALRRHVPGYRPLAFAPPYGSYGQLDTNDPAIPTLLRHELSARFPLIFTQADPVAARPGEGDVPRFQLDRLVTGGALRDWLAGS